MRLAVASLPLPALVANPAGNAPLWGSARTWFHKLERCKKLVGTADAAILPGEILRNETRAKTEGRAPPRGTR